MEMFVEVKVFEFDRLVSINLRHIMSICADNMNVDTLTRLTTMDNGHYIIEANYEEFLSRINVMYHEQFDRFACFLRLPK